jgi:hypothetical protein
MSGQHNSSLVNLFFTILSIQKALLYIFLFNRKLEKTLMLIFVTLKVHKIEIFFGFDFGICTFS